MVVDQHGIGAVYRNDVALVEHFKEDSHGTQQKFCPGAQIKSGDKGMLVLQRVFRIAIIRKQDIYPGPGQQVR